MITLAHKTSVFLTTYAHRFLSMGIIFMAMGIMAFQSSETPSEKTDPVTKEELKAVFKTKMLNIWYPRYIDTIYGGYYSNFDSTWSLENNQPKFIVTQGRHIWVLSTVYKQDPSFTNYPKYAKQGFKFLKDHMWDSINGGFYQMVNQNGSISERGKTADKVTYGNSFAIYGCAALYSITSDPEVLDLAIKGFRWLDAHAHDSIYGGYFQNMKADGSLYPGAPQNFKDYNSSIHVLEALAELYKVWPDSVLKDRTEEMIDVTKNKIIGEKHHMGMVFYPDWTMVPDEVIKNSGIQPNRQLMTFGHDVETAYLLLEATEALGHEPDEEFWDFFKKVCDKALKNGLDQEKGGMFAFGVMEDGKLKITETYKEWWVQFELLNSLNILKNKYPEEPRYSELFDKTWRYMDKYLIDHEYGGTYHGGWDENSLIKMRAKGAIWQGTYHTARTMLNCTR